MTAADYRLLTDATGQRMAAALEGMSVDRAAKTDLTSIIATGTTNTTGASITVGTYFYLNGTLVQALTDIPSGATFTSGTNYESVTAGGLNSLCSQFENYDLGTFSTNISDVENGFLTFHNNQTRKFNGRMLPIGFTTTGSASDFSPLSTTNYAGFYIQLNSTYRFKIICWPGNSSRSFFIYSYINSDNHVWSTFIAA